MSTFDGLVIAVSRDLRDPSNTTFSTAMIADFINEAQAEVGRLAPRRFQQNIVPAIDTLTYTVDDGSPEIELRRVELWDYSAAPERFVWKFSPVSGEYDDATVTGWSFWNGQLLLSNPQARMIDPSIHQLRLWGWGTYPVVSGSTVMPVSTELEQAMRHYCRVLGLRSILNNRALYTQWQSQPHGDDVTYASMAAALSTAEAEWDRRAKHIYRPRGGI